MIRLKKTAILFLTITLYPFCSNAADMGPQSGRHQGPPPEAFQACSGKNAGDTAQFQSPRGDTVTGTCAKQGDQLVLRPDRAGRRPGGSSDRGGQQGENDQKGMNNRGNNQGGRGGQQQGPPPEAYQACDGKSAGDTAQFQSPHGDTVSGTCFDDGNGLVLRPDHPRNDQNGPQRNERPQ